LASLLNSIVVLIGYMKSHMKSFSGSMDLRLSMVKKLEETPVVSDPEIYRNLREDPRFQQFETSKSAF